MSAADLAWIQAITKMHQKIDKPFQATTINMTRAKMYELAASLRYCQRELSRIGAPSDRLRPAYDLVKQACRIYAKGARCFARAASVSDPGGAVLAGSPAERIQGRANACGFAGQGNGSNRLVDAEARAATIRGQFP